MGAYLTIKPYNDKSLQMLSFTARAKTVSNTNGTDTYKENPIVDPSLKRKGDLGDVTNVSFFVRKQINENAYKAQKSTDEYLRSIMKSNVYIPAVTPVESKSAKIGDTKITTLMDGEQIFDKTYEMLKGAKSSILVEMFEFQNLTVDGDKWAQGGAEKLSDAAEKQQKILGMLIRKKQEFPNMKIQIILDAHKWYIDSHGPRKHYGNADMIKFLKKNGIDVVPYPRASQQGAALQHVKMVAVDGKKVILGGMNWGTHSAANHDACVLIETQDKKTHSEVDNIIEGIFIPDWKFAWKKLGETRLAPGPLSEDEQKYYGGIDKEIKQENVDYVNLLKEYYETPQMQNRYRDGDLELAKVNLVDAPKIQVLATKPRELEEVGEEGNESTREYLLEKIRTCKKMRAEVFVLTDKEIIKILSQRINNGELRKEDVQIIIDPGIKEIFPYCETGYDELMEQGVPVRLYKTDKGINQRMHSKWAVFDDKEVMIGSTNWSAMGLNQNLRTGKRDDYDLNTEAINNEIKDYIERVRDSEELLGLPPLTWNGEIQDYVALKARMKSITKARKAVKAKVEAHIEIDGQKYHLKEDDNLTVQKKLRTIHGYYGIIQKRHNAKESYKRGNNEMSIAFVSPSLAQGVFQKQFDRDWKHSESEYEKMKNKELNLKRLEPFDTVG